MTGCRAHGWSVDGLLRRRHGCSFWLDPAKIPTLKPAFAADGTVTAASSASISDGAAALILTRASRAAREGVTPLATIRGYVSHATDPEWFTLAPVGAMQSS
jgi:acetyl-CoA C-acetyltransferase